MSIEEAQRDVRRTFLGGFVGQGVAGLLWLASACLATWGSLVDGFVLLTFGGILIFPLTLAGLRMLGMPAGLPRGHPMNALGTQAALMLPSCLPVVAAAAMARIDWFYPAFMVVLGAHYLPFAFLYGMRLFLLLGVLLVAGGVGFGLTTAGGGSGPAWFTGAALTAFAWAGRQVALGEAAQAPVQATDAPPLHSS